MLLPTLAVMEKLVPISIKMGLDLAKDNAHPLIGFMLHKGADGFMSPEQFSTFYWPPLKKVMMGLIEEGFVPLLLCEGTYTSRLETIADIPRGKCIYWFETVDWPKAKAILGESVCIRGGIAASTLFSGTVQQMQDSIRQLIDVAGRGEVDLDIPHDITIKPCKEFTAAVNQTMGDEVLTYEKKPVTVSQQKRKNGAWKKREATA